MMWDIYSMNFHLRGLPFNYVDPVIVKKYSKAEPAEVGPLTNRRLIKLCDKFLPLKHGNIFHGSSHTLLKNLQSDAESAYPLIPESFYGLLCEFLEIKLKYGTEREKEIYEGMSACDLVDRLLTKRCVSYFGRRENYLLSTGQRGQGDFAKVGTDEESAPLLMKDCLTRDEIKLTGFLLISSRVTKVIRDKNYSVVMIGIPFPILNQEGLHDWEEIMITRRQNIPTKGYGPIPPDLPKDSEMYGRMKLRAAWNSLYGQRATLFHGIERNPDTTKGRFNGGHYEAAEDRLPRYLKLPRMTFVHLPSLVARLSVITMAILAEGNARAALGGQMAYLVIDKNKIGLANHPEIYETLFLRNLAYELLCQYRDLNSVFCLQLIDFKENRSLKCGSKMYLMDGVFGNQHPNEGIEIKYSTRGEWRIEDVPVEYLIVETYRLDANAMPGNELWLGKVSKDHWHPSFDVRHTAIPFIHNPLINGTRLCGRNMRCFDMYGLRLWRDIHSVNY